MNNTVSGPGRFEWDITKARSNLVDHGVAFEDAERVFEDAYALYNKDWVIDGEQRWHVTGAVGNMNILLVVHTVNYDNEEVIRIISARRANKRERRDYQQARYARPSFFA